MISTFFVRGPQARARPYSKLLLRSAPPRGSKQTGISWHARRQQSSSATTSSPRPKDDGVFPNADQARADAPLREQTSRKGTEGAESISEAGADSIPVPSAAAPVSFWHRLGPLTRAGQAYSRAHERHPWALQVVSAMVVFSLGDFAAQQIGKSGEETDTEMGGRTGHDWSRTARALTIGGTMAIPAHLWFTFLAGRFNYPSKLLSVGIKVLVNQLVFTPTINTYFFGAQVILSGGTPAEAWTRIRDAVPTSIRNAWKFWPAVMAFNFAFVPLPFRSQFMGCISVGWQTYLSYLNKRAESLEKARHQLREDRADDGVASLKAVAVSL